MFLAFSTEAEYTIKEIFEYMDSDERAEMFALLKTDAQLFINEHNPGDAVFNSALDRLQNNRHRLSTNDEETIIRISNKL